MLATLTREETALVSARARLTALGPAATLARGYAVVQFSDDSSNLRVLRSVSEVAPGARLRVRVADGAMHAVSTDGTTDAEPEG